METLFTRPRHPYTRLRSRPRPTCTDREVVSIGGAPPRLDEPNNGLPFQPRCDVVLDRCAEEHPALRLVGAGHEARAIGEGRARVDRQPGVPLLEVEI